MDRRKKEKERERKRLHRMSSQTEHRLHLPMTSCVNEADSYTVSTCSSQTNQQKQSDSYYPETQPHKSSTQQSKMISDEVVSSTLSSDIQKSKLDKDFSFPHISLSQTISKTQSPDSTSEVRTNIPTLQQKKCSRESKKLSRKKVVSSTVSADFINFKPDNDLNLSDISPSPTIHKKLSAGSTTDRSCVENKELSKEKVASSTVAAHLLKAQLDKPSQTPHKKLSACSALEVKTVESTIQPDRCSRECKKYSRDKVVMPRLSANMPKSKLDMDFTRSEIAPSLTAHKRQYVGSTPKVSPIESTILPARSLTESKKLSRDMAIEDSTVTCVTDHSTLKQSSPSLGNYFRDQQDKMKQKKLNRKQKILTAVQNKRLCQDYRFHERERETKGRKKRRQTLEYKRAETDRETEQRKKKRKATEYKNREKDRETEERKKKRTATDYKIKEAGRETEQRRKKRETTEYKSEETQRETEERRNKRKVTEYKIKETERETAQRCKKRKITGFKKKEIERETEERRNKRKVTEYKKRETERETEQRCKKRKITEFKRKEIERETEGKKKKRKAIEYKNKERNRETVTKRTKRLNADIQEQELLRKHQRKQAKNPKTYEQLIRTFHSAVAEGPTYVCTSCEQLYYKQSVQTVSESLKKAKTADICLQGHTSESGKEWICMTCKKHIMKHSIPPWAIANKMAFPDIPPCLGDLYPLELRLVATRIPFMKIYQAPRGKQLKISGNVVNVPSNMVQTVTSLPRLPDQDGTIKVNLKRKLSYSSSVVTQNIRPNKVREAAKFLVENSPLYKKDNISFDTTWTYDTNTAPEVEEDVHSVSDMNNNDIHIPVTTPSTETDCQQTSTGTLPNQNEEIIERDDWNEIDETEIHGGTTDTMFTAPDFIEEEEKDNIWSFAPGQGNIPTSIFKDTNCEELSFPGIFGGTPRPENKDRSAKIYYSDIVKSEIRRKDRRVARCVDNLFFKVKKLQMQQIFDKSQIALRKLTGKNGPLTAGVLKKDGAIANLVHLDEGYRVLRTVRGSPPYFEQAKKDLFALIRQLGPATLFLSFSAAETQWIHLLKILSKIVDGLDLTDDDIMNLTWEEKTRLIQTDPVTCSRHFHYSVQELLKFLNNSLQPLGRKMLDFFYRVEYQHRGSPHIHMLVWLEAAPKYAEDSDEAVISFIDSIISCSENHPYAKFQMHRHSRTCKKGNKKQCRFHFPKPPMQETMILTPLEDTENKELHVNNFKRILANLQAMGMGEPLTLDELLFGLEISEEEYILAIRSSIVSPTVFLKRSLSEIRVNAYVPTCLSAWRANMDSQYITDIYQCAMYVVAYISKSQRGMSILLDNACKESKEKSSNIKEKVRHIGNKFTNNVEMSAQEAVDICLQVPLRKSSRQVIFVPTSESANRTYLLKSFQQLQNMEDEDDQVAAGNLITRYIDRPHALENVTLADWAAWYDKSVQMKESSEDVLCEVPEPENELEDFVPHPSSHSHSLKKRKTARILRSVRYNKEHDPENHCREKIMLYTNWRDEKQLKGNCLTYQARYKQIEQTIQEQIQSYEPNAVAVDSAEAVVQEELANDEIFNVAPNAEHANQQDQQQPDVIHDTTLFPPAGMPQSDIGSELGIPTSVDRDNQIPYHEMKDDEYRCLVRSLNDKQKEFFMDIMTKIKTKDSPFYAFLSGGAGVGKSRVLTAIYQASMKYYNSIPGTDFNTRHVIVIAPTGKAAYNVSGNTIQSAFRIPVNQGLSMETPPSDKLNTLRTELGQLKLVIIDEISMVGFRMFNLIHKRLQDIKGCSKDFGGVSVICFGDLFQLKPVFDTYIFNNSSSGTCALATNLWEKHFHMYELTEIMRQRDSLILAQLLNRLRENHQTPADIELLLSKTCSPTQATYPTASQHLFLENARVTSWNDMIFNTASGDKYVSKAHDIVVGNVSSDLADQIKAQIPTNPSKTMQLKQELSLAVDLNYEICLNVNIADGLTNGANGTIKLLQVPHSSNQAAGVVWIKFQDQTVGSETRSINKHLYKRGIDFAWTPITPIGRQFRVGKHKSGEVIRTQFPLRPCAAKTIHRAQGETLDSIVVDFSVLNKHIRKPFFQHAHYVGLSRVTTLNGLHILDLNVEKMCVNPGVVSEMERLRTTAVYNIDFNPLYNLKNHFVVTYNNARSLHKHFSDCSHDPNLLASDLLIFSETRFRTTDMDQQYHLPGHFIYRNDEQTISPHARPSHGTVVYSKHKFLDQFPKALNIPGGEITSIRTVHLPELLIVAVYKAPNTARKSIEDALGKVLPSTDNVIILGDFNIDITKDSQIQLPTTFHQCLTDPTTQYKTRIDHIYTNLDNKYYTSGTLQAHWSDHSIIWIGINQQ